MAELTVYGAPWCPDCRRTKTFLGEHRLAYDWIDVDEQPEALERMMALQGGGRSIPTVVFDDGSFVVEPTNEELAQNLGLQSEPECDFYDLAIVGGGPAGLAAALYAAREGIQTIVIDRSALGGQAGLAERIDNYPGFPDGIGGADLADRFVAQVQKYEVEMLSAVSVDAVMRDGAEVGMKLSTGALVGAHAAILAPGTSYRRLGVPGEDDLIGSGVHFCATCDGPFYRGEQELLVVGGGNSGFEESLFLSQFVDHIRLIDRNPTPKASLLLQAKVEEKERISFHPNTEVVELNGDGKLQEVVVRNVESGETETWNPSAAFVYVGLDPNTQFLDGAVDLDQWGFMQASPTFETSMAGVFAAGDARAGATKQLGSAVGDGIAAMLMARQYLQEHSHVSATSPND